MSKLSKEEQEKRTDRKLKPNKELAPAEKNLSSANIIRGKK